MKRGLFLMCLLPAIVVADDLSPYYQDATSYGSTFNSGILETTKDESQAQDTVPNYGSEAPAEEALLGDGKTGVDTEAVGKVTSCASDPLNPDAFLAQECDAINFWQTNPSVHPEYEISRSSDPLVSTTTLITSDPWATLGNMPTLTGSYSGCVDSEIPGSPIHEIHRCEETGVIESEGCEKYWDVQVDQDYDYECIDTLVVKSEEQCTKHLVVDMIWDEHLVIPENALATFYYTTNNPAPTIIHLATIGFKKIAGYSDKYDVYFTQLVYVNYVGSPTMPSGLSPVFNLYVRQGGATLYTKESYSPPYHSGVFSTIAIGEIEINDALNAPGVEIELNLVSYQRAEINYSLIESQLDSPLIASSKDCSLGGTVSWYWNYFDEDTTLFPLNHVLYSDNPNGSVINDITIQLIQKNDPIPVDNWDNQCATLEARAQ